MSAGTARALGLGEWVELRPHLEGALRFEMLANTGLPWCAVSPPPRDEAEAQERREFLRQVDPRPERAALAFHAMPPGRMLGVIDLAGLEIPAQLPVLLQHRTTDWVGEATRVGHTARGLLVEGYLLPGLNPRVDELARAGFPWRASISTEIEAHEPLLESESTTVNGHAVRGPLSIRRRTRLAEVTLTTGLPGDPGTWIRFDGAPAVFRGEPGAIAPEEYQRAWRRQELPRNAADAFLLWEHCPELRREFADHRPAFELFLSRM